MTKLTKAEREELPARIQAAIATVCSGMAAMSIPANPRDVDLVLADCAKALADLDAAEAERDEAVALIDAAKSDVRPESFLEHAQAILAKCIAPYSCEQMKAVGDALAACYRKWELMSEFAMKAGEERDELAAKLAAAEAAHSEMFLSGQVAELRAKLADVATLAHASGIANLSQGAALNSIRKLTLAHWDRSTEADRVSAAIAAARGIQP